jgi:hypothetical protein
LNELRLIPKINVHGRSGEEGRLNRFFLCTGLLLLIAAVFAAGVWVGRSTALRQAPGKAERPRPEAGAGRETARPAPEAPRQILTDREARSVSVPAVVLKQGQYKELRGAIEYAAVAGGGMSQRARHHFSNFHRAYPVCSGQTHSEMKSLNPSW